ncbi:hypothetical protein BDR03DRAFT_936669 [Suillus americanus]|nr:hypothetical protein BDR03DRAFT_936669 [Suillus americanus]
MTVTLCPNCKKQCQSAEAVLEHLNSADTCWPENLINRSMLPVPQALQQPPGQTDLSAKYHPTSGYHYLLPDKPPPQNIFQEMQSHPLQEARETNVWYPFDGLGEWSLAKFLVENLYQMQIDKFLKLDWCQFGEFWTSDDAWEIQNQLPKGATIIPIIAASDKTPVTKHTGGLEMYPLFLSIRNIQGDVRMKVTSHAWRCTAFMPIPTFIINSDFQTLLRSHLWHKCMDLVCSNLKVAARIGEYMIDPSARLRYCFTPLISHIADLPKQLMIACVTKKSSPITTVTQKEFGDETPHPPWNGIDTYTCIQQLCTRVDPWDLVVFLREAKKLYLSGVHLLYWRNWRRSNPARFLTPEIVHALHKFFF